MAWLARWLATAGMAVLDCRRRARHADASSSISLSSTDRLCPTPGQRPVEGLLSDRWALAPFANSGSLSAERRLMAEVSAVGGHQRSSFDASAHQARSLLTRCSRQRRNMAFAPPLEAMTTSNI